MNYFYSAVLISVIFLVACSTSQELTYRPVDSKDLWNIRIERGSVSGQFEVYIDDEIVFEETPDMFNDRIDEKTTYKNYPLRLLVNKETDFWGGEEYNLQLFINNELVTQMKY
ncbi:MAG: hypothetical protein HND39_03200 [Ignavibacteriota bacterium]|jgi:hypothetical protein|nr:hypothetical protein [Ignavibacteriota bacterium]MCC7092845.1 hypothetical protein [Ignavibacteriaceae bacterium]MEB2297016.1 hypothetical protein [Ignavibacteria bacterium]MEB2355698.1 hypothetical protein [Ignavibacteriales bacterium]MCZ7615957.1 hypothetical protein [Ignavibacteriaceae bacterium]